MKWSAVGILALCGRAAADPAVAVGGYVETSYQLHLQEPSNQVTALRGFDDRDRTFTVENAALDARGAEGPVSARLILQVGETGRAYYAAEPSDPTLWRNLQQASAAYTTGGKVVIEAGLFPSPIGPEVLPIKDNWTWSRSDLFYALPFYHTGARASVPLGGAWTATLHAYNGWNSAVDNNPYPSAALSAAYAGKRIQAQVLYFGGVERPRDRGTPWRSLLDAYATVTLDRIAVTAQADAGVETHRRGWAAGSVTGKLALAPCLYAAARADAIREWGGAAMLIPVRWLGSATVTLAYQPAANVSVRLELRHDHAAEDAYFGGAVSADPTTGADVANRTSQDTLTLGATAWF